MRKRTLFFAVGFALVLAASGRAQRVGVAVQRGPYYVGEPMVVQVQVENVTSGKQPTCKLKTVAPTGLTIQGPRVNQSTSSSVQIFNGRVTRKESADYQFSFIVTASRQGTFEVGPFEVSVDGRNRQLQSKRIEFKELQPDPNMQISLSMPRPRVYSGERVPVTIRWAYAGEISEVRYAFSNLQIRSPLFDQFSFRDVRPKTRTTLSLMTAKGEVQLDAKVTKEKQGNKEYIVVTGQRTLVADAPGVYDAPITCRTKKVVRWRRDFFGDLVPGSTAPSLSAGKTARLEVRALPLAGRPSSFSGAVGKDYTIEVAANRSVVRVGDPISLQVTIKGQGDLERLSLPDLSGAGDFSDFDLPAEKPTGTVADGAKQFKLSVRAKTESIQDLPPIEFAWFDPEAEKYVTARSKPVALRVMKAQIVSASNVVSRPRVGNQGSTSPSGSQSVSLVGADLAIEKDVSQLWQSTSLPVQSLVAICLYILGFGLLSLGLVWRLRGRADPIAQQQQRHYKQVKRQVLDARSLSLSAAAEQIGRALRSVQAEAGDVDRKALDELIERCDNHTYAPAGAENTEVRDELVDRAIAVLERA